MARSDEHRAKVFTGTRAPMGDAAGPAIAFTDAVAWAVGAWLRSQERNVYWTVANRQRLVTGRHLALHRWQLWSTDHFGR